MFALSRALVLLGLLPQLLGLGLGSGVVLCIAPQGHLRLEVASEACCDEWATDGSGPAFADRDAPVVPDDCEECHDLSLSAERQLARVVDEDASSASRTAGALEPTLVPPRGSGFRPAARRHVQDLVPVRLLALRSVVQRC